MNTPIPVIVDGQAGIFAHSKARVATLNAKAKERLCLMDARIRTLMAEPEEGAATAEYAVVLVAATGFAAVLVAILWGMKRLGLGSSLGSRAANQ